MAVAILGAALVFPGLAGAATYVVNKTGDHTPNGCTAKDCTLREAVIAANGHFGADTIELGAKTYTLSLPGTKEDLAVNGDLDIRDSVTIVGKGASATVIDGGGATVHEAAFDVFAPATLNSLTVQNSANTDPARSSGIYVEGGAALRMSHARVTQNDNAGVDCCSGIYAPNLGPGAAPVTLDHVVVDHNTGTGSACCDGASFGGKATLSHVTVSDNGGGQCCNGLEVGDGAAKLTDVRVINNDGATSCCNGLELGDGDATLRRVVVSGSDSPGCCNGYEGSQGSVKAVDLVVSDNTGTQCCQGFETGAGTETITGMTVSGNQGTAPTADCMGICLGTTKLNLTNVTVSGNSAPSTGGGIDVNSTTSLFLNNVTVTGNTADSDNSGGGNGGGINVYPGGSVRIQNSIVAGNSVGTSGSGPDCFGTLTSKGHNLIGDTSDCTIASGGGNLLGVDPLLGPLKDNGGFTKTHALKAGSPAIDHGSPKTPGSGGTACAKTDQRGVKRPQGPRCDIGAYERQ